jgi:hypothetical protein
MAVIFFLSILGIVFCPYSMCLLWDNRSAWNDPDPRIRRLCRRRMVVAWAMNIIMVAAVLLILGGILQSCFAVRRGYPHDFPGEPLRL